MPTPEYGDDVVTDTLPLAEISAGELSGRVVSDGSGLALHVDRGAGASLRLRLGVTVGGRDLAAHAEFVRRRTD